MSYVWLMFATSWILLGLAILLFIGSITGVIYLTMGITGVIAYLMGFIDGERNRERRKYE